MSTLTTNLSLVKPATTDNADIAVINANMDLLDAAVASKETPTGSQAKADVVQTNLASHLTDYVRQPGYALATGSANTYVLTLSPVPTSYVDGMGIAIKINVANTGASTVNVNSLGAKALKDPVGNDFATGMLLLNKIYSFKYDLVSGTFIQQGRGGDVNLVTGNIKSGVSIYGVAGKASVVDTSDANAIASQILSGLYAYVNGSKLLGTATIETLGGKKWATGTGTSDSSMKLTVSGLGFQPAFVFGWQTDTDATIDKISIFFASQAMNISQSGVANMGQLMAYWQNSMQAIYAQSVQAINASGFVVAVAFASKAQKWFAIGA